MSRLWCVLVAGVFLMGCGSSSNTVSDKVMTDATHSHYHVHGAGIDHGHTHPEFVNGGHAHEHGGHER